jgi:hypothetical protein
VPPSERFGEYGIRFDNGVESRPLIAKGLMNMSAKFNATTGFRKAYLVKSIFYVTSFKTSF